MANSNWLNKVITRESDPLNANAQELRKEIQRIGLEGNFMAIYVEQEVIDMMSSSPAVIILPSALFFQTVDRELIDQETMIIGLRQSIETLREYEPTAVLAESLLSLARMTAEYDSLNNRMQLALEAISILSVANMQHRIGRAYIALGEILYESGYFYDALQAFQRATEAAEQASDDGVAIASLHGRAVTCVSIGLGVEALDLLDEALERIPNTEFAVEWHSELLLATVRANLVLKRYPAALECTNRWLELTGEEYGPRFYRGEIFSALQEPEDALREYLIAAIGAAADIRDMRSTRFKQARRENLEVVFQRALSAAVKNGSTDVAFGLVELSLSDASIAERVPGEQREWDVGARLAVADAAKELVDEARRAVLDGNRDNLQKIEEQAEWLVARHDLLRRPWTVEEISQDDVSLWASQVQSTLPSECILVEFANVGDEVHEFIVSPDLVFERSVGLSVDEIRLLAFSFTRECNGRFSTCALNLLASRLLNPVADIVGTARSIIIVPTVELQGVPLHAMQLHGEALVKTCSISYARRAKEIVDASARGSRPIGQESSWIGLSVPRLDYADVPELPGVRSELVNAGAVFNSPSMVLDSPATSRDLFEAVTNYQIVHLGCHSEITPGAPLLSRLLLADRPVFAFEIMLADISAEYVILSGCGTASVYGNTPRRAQNLAYAFVSGGARALLGSLWSVEDDSGSECMHQFYKLLAGGDKRPAEALRKAQCFLMDDTSKNHPYYWAPFAVFGVG